MPRTGTPTVCTCSSSRMQCNNEAVFAPFPVMTTTAATTTSAGILQEGEESIREFERVGTFHYQSKCQHLRSKESCCLNGNDDDNSSSKLTRRCSDSSVSSSSCTGLTRSCCAEDCLFIGGGDSSAVASATFAGDDKISKKLVVAVEESSASLAHDLPAVVLNKDAVVEIPALCLCSKTEDHHNHNQCHHHQQHSHCHHHHHYHIPPPASGTLPEVVATPVVEAVPNGCMYEGSLNGSGRSGGRTAWNRPEFSSATVVRTSVEEKFGIKFHCSETPPSNSRRHRHTTNSSSFPRISQMYAEGLLAEAPFCVGDLLISINKQSCRGVTPDQFALFLSNLTGTITFVVQHPGGDASLVESFLRKPTPSSKTGIGMTYSPRQNCLRVKHVHFEGLLVEGLLQVDDRIVAINHIPCQYWDARTAAEQIARSPLWVSIVARRHRHAGVVLTAHDAPQMVPSVTSGDSASRRSTRRGYHKQPASREPVLVTRQGRMPAATSWPPPPHHDRSMFTGLLLNYLSIRRGGLRRTTRSGTGTGNQRPCDGGHHR